MILLKINDNFDVLVIVKDGYTLVKFGKYEFCKHVRLTSDVDRFVCKLKDYANCKAFLHLKHGKISKHHLVHSRRCANTPE